MATELTDEEKAALKEKAEGEAAAARKSAKDLVKEALKEFQTENSPKNRTEQPKPSLLNTLFGM